MPRRAEVDVRRLKEKATELFRKGKFAKSAETWKEICEADQKDNQSRLRLGDALAKAGQAPAAYDAYREAAEGFARQGFLPQAVAAAKLALTINPDDEAVTKLLADFHVERFGVRPPTASKPAPTAGADAVAQAVLAPAAPSFSALPPIARAAPEPVAPRPAPQPAGPPPALQPAQQLAGPTPALQPAGPTPALRPVADAIAQALADDAASADGSPFADSLPFADRSPFADHPPEEAPPPLTPPPPAPSPPGEAEPVGPVPKRPVRVLSRKSSIMRPPETPPAPPTPPPPPPEADVYAPALDAAPLQSRQSGLRPPSGRAAPDEGAARPTSTSRASGLRPVPDATVGFGPGPAEAEAGASARPPSAPRGAVSRSGTGLPPVSADARPVSAPRPTSRPSDTPPGGAVAPRSAVAPPRRASITLGDDSRAASPSAIPLGTEPGTPSTVFVEGLDLASPNVTLQPSARPARVSVDLDLSQPASPAEPAVGVGLSVTREAPALQLPPERPAARADDALPVTREGPALQLPPERPAAQARGDALPVTREGPALQVPAGVAGGEETLRPGEVGTATVLGDAQLVAELREQLKDRTVVAVSPLPPEAPPTPPPLAPLADERDDGGLAKVQLFADLSPEAFGTLLQAAHMVRLGRGEVAVEQGSTGDAIYAILNGRVRVYRQEGGTRRELAILEAGAIFGEMAMVTGAPRSAWVVAEVDDTTVLQVPKQLLVDLVPANPSIGAALSTLARRRILLNLTAAEPLFAGLKRAERLDLIDQFEVLEVARGEQLVGPRAERGGLFVLISGEVELRTAERRATLAPVMLLGDAELLRGPGKDTVVATERSEVLCLPEGPAGKLRRHASVTSRLDALVAAAMARFKR